MEVGYFKASEFGDCYVPINNFKLDCTNIISLDLKRITIISSGKFNGFFRYGKIDKKDFENLKEAAKNQDRVKGINLIKRIHENNPNIDDGSYYELGDWYLEEERKYKARVIYENSKPILK